MGFLLNALWRMHQHRSWSRCWFVIDKPARIKAGAGPDGLYPHERSAADKERIGLKEPAKPKPCAWKAEHGYCDCARMLREKDR